MNRHLSDKNRFEIKSKFHSLNNNNNNNNNNTYIAPISILVFSPALKNKNT